MAFLPGSLPPSNFQWRRKQHRSARMKSEDGVVQGVPIEEIEKHPNVKFHRQGILNDEVQKYGEDTKVVKGGSHPEEWSTDPLQRTVVNPPVYHNSTVLFKTTAAYKYAASDWPFTGMWYGRHGNPTSWALEEAFAVIEGGYAACATGSGVAANNAAILAFVESGDHLIVTDGCYDPTREFCDGFLKRFKVETTYVSPLITPDELAKEIRPNTKIVFVESPSSLSFEIMDIPALAKVAHDAGAVVLCDNTWGPLVFKSHEMGCDVTINAATKYIGGHSDIMLGLISAKDETLYRKVKNSVRELGCPPGPDDCYLALRGLRTLGVRMRQHDVTTLQIAEWLEGRPEVARVMHPGLPSHPQHDLFKRDFTGGTGLFGFQLKPYSEKAVEAMIDNMKIFAIGFSWGGYESIVMPTKINKVRSVEYWDYGEGFGPTLRLNIGLESVEDLIVDLEEGFKRLNAAE